MEQKQPPPYPLRMPPEMRSHLEDVAKASGRSLNAEIVAELSELQALRDLCESQKNEIEEQRHALNALRVERTESKRIDREEWHRNASEMRALRDTARLYQLRYRDLCILFNMYYAVIRAAVEDHRIDAEALGYYGSVFELVEKILTDEEGREAPAKAITEFLRGVDQPLVVAALRSAFEWVEYAMNLLSPPADDAQQPEEVKKASLVKRRTRKPKS